MTTFPKITYRTLVCGSRSYRGDEQLVLDTLSRFHRDFPFAALICGGATGIDTLAVKWASRNDIPVEIFPADWDDLSHPEAVIRTRMTGEKYDAAAGPRRNRRMIKEGRPELVLAFPGGRGTQNMVRLARKHRIPIILVCKNGHAAATCNYYAS